MLIMNRKITALFIVTNGIGLGHVTRGMAVAKRLHKHCSYIEPIFFTTSVATDLIRQQGFFFYYYPSYEQIKSKMTKEEWQIEMKRQISDVIKRYEIKAIVYDGAYPYEAVLNLLEENKDIMGIWLKREGDKRNHSQYDLKTQTYFKRVIVPMEAGVEYEELESDCKKVRCDTIMLLDRQEALKREQVRFQYGIKKGEDLIYIQLGAGKINPIKEILNLVIKVLLKERKNRILLGESPVGSQITIKDSKIIKVRTYPNAMLFNGIDYAVSAAGYNTFHELLYFGVPTLFIPNKNTAKDDQTGRAFHAEENYAGVVLEQFDGQEIKEKISYLKKNHYWIKENALRLIPENGAEQAATIILRDLKRQYW